MRDPRIDPQAGDIVGHDKNRRHVAMRVQDFVFYRRGTVPNPKEEPRRCSLEMWKTWSEGGSIIRAD